MLLLMFISLPPCVYGEDVLPVFKGSWAFVPYPYVLGKDACNVDIPLLTDVNSSSQQTAVLALSQPEPPYTSCSGAVTFGGRAYPDYPETFPGSWSDWEEILMEPSNPGLEIWSDQCKWVYTNPDGQVLSGVDHYVIDVNPIYICPKNSMAYESVYNDQGCTTKPFPCAGDVVGRDLDIPMINVEGHVGITHYSSNEESGTVLEVVNQKPAITTTSLVEFKNKESAPYWGEKYGLQYKEYLTQGEGNAILKAGEDQKMYHPVYTETWDWHPGGDAAKYIYNSALKQWQEIYTTENAVFRCDSFVYYCYLLGLNREIIHYEFPVAPKDIYNALLFSRPSSSSSELTQNNQEITTSNQNHPTILEDQKKQIETIYAGNKLDAFRFWEALELFTKNPSAPRMEKLEFLWSVAEKYADNPTKFQFMIDYLRKMKPIELLPQFIQGFQKQKDAMNKIHLLIVMVDAVDFNPASQELSGSADAVTNVKLIQDFFSNLLEQEKDPTVLEAAINLYAEIMPPMQAYSGIQKALHRADIKQITNGKPLLTDQEYYFRQLAIAFSTPEMQDSLLSQLLTERTGLTAEQQRIFDFALCSNLGRLPPERINNNQRKELEQFLLAHQAPLIAKLTLDEETNLPVCNWISAYGSVKAQRADEKYSEMIKYIKDLKNPILQAQLIPWLRITPLKWDGIKHVDKADTKYLYDIFMKKLADPALTKSDKDDLFAGINALSDYLPGK